MKKLVEGVGIEPTSTTSPPIIGGVIHSTADDTLCTITRFSLYAPRNAAYSLCTSVSASQTVYRCLLGGYQPV